MEEKIKKYIETKPRTANEVAEKFGLTVYTATKYLKKHVLVYRTTGKRGRPPHAYTTAVYLAVR